ncbi:MAG: hypothetical protein P8J93_07860 [SAR86 cluster bacterium]|nr:hypothetical protein [SAR86 cluster bacterium]|tara:strand:- start:3860 stop:4876 length:1017 start_codon:yes stop_codon:yes gene_type:complete
MKEEYIVKLDPEDEYTHTPDESSNYNESMYFNVFDHKKKIGGWFRLGNRPNEGYSEMSCCLYLPDGKVGFMFGKPSISDNNSFNAGGMSFEVLEPFKRLHIEYKGKILLLSDPQQMMNPGKAFKSNPTVDCQVSLGILGESPMYGGETLKKDGSALDVDPEKSFSKAHYEQHISGKGLMKIGEKEFSIKGLGLRDKSWGPRYWQALEWYRWLTININKDIGFMFSIVHQGDGIERRGGLVFIDNKYHNIQECKIQTKYDENFCQTSLKAWAKTKVGEYEVEGNILSLIPLRNRRTSPDGKVLTTRITEGMTEYTYQGMKGYGMSEYLDQIIDGKPIGV